MFKSDLLNAEHITISHRLADLPILTAVFAFGKGKEFDGEIHALSASSLLPWGSDLFLSLLAHVLNSVAFFLEGHTHLKYLIIFTSWVIIPNSLGTIPEL